MRPSLPPDGQVGEKLWSCIQAFNNKLLALDRCNYPWPKLGPYLK
jgi:hypothetical protein